MIPIQPLRGSSPPLNGGNDPDVAAELKYQVVQVGGRHGAQDHWLDARGLLPRPRQGPFGFDAPAVVRPDAGAADLPGTEQQFVPKWVPSRKSLKWRSSAPV